MWGIGGDKQLLTTTTNSSSGLRAEMGRIQRTLRERAKPYTEHFLENYNSLHCTLLWCVFQCSRFRRAVLCQRRTR